MWEIRVSDVFTEDELQGFYQREEHKVVYPQLLEEIVPKTFYPAVGPDLDHNEVTSAGFSLLCHHQKTSEKRLAARLPSTVKRLGSGKKAFSPHAPLPALDPHYPVGY